MRSDLTATETLCLLRSEPYSVATPGEQLATLVGCHLNRCVEELDSAGFDTISVTLIENLRLWIKDGGEIHLVENGKNPGKVIAVRCDG